MSNLSGLKRTLLKQDYYLNKYALRAKRSNNDVEFRQWNSLSSVTQGYVNHIRLMSQNPQSALKNPKYILEKLTMMSHHTKKCGNLIRMKAGGKSVDLRRAE